MLKHLDDFLLYIQTNNYSPETLYNYERDLKVFSDFLENEVKIPLEIATKKTVEQYKAYLVSRDRRTPKTRQRAQKTLAVGSINRNLSSLRQYLKYLIKMGYEAPLDPSAIELLRMPKKHPRVAEFEQIIRLIEAPSRFERHKVVALRNRAMLETLFSTGMRISELLGLKLTQIDKTGRVFIRGKGKKERFVYLTNRAQKHIKEYLAVRGDDPSPFLFVPLRGKNARQRDKKISSNYLEEKVKNYRELLGLNIPVTVHGIRHAFATYLAESGANPAAIQILLGHESLDTTTRYVHASDRYAERMHKKYHPLKE